jgi:hypothetical protein
MARWLVFGYLRQEITVQVEAETALAAVAIAREWVPSTWQLVGNSAKVVAHSALQLDKPMACAKKKP